MGVELELTALSGPRVVQLKRVAEGADLSREWSGESLAARRGINGLAVRRMWCGTGSENAANRQADAAKEHERSEASSGVVHEFPPGILCARLKSAGS